MSVNDYVQMHEENIRSAFATVSEFVQRTNIVKAARVNLKAKSPEFEPSAWV